jgi:hemerythrin superfamily protein
MTESESVNGTKTASENNGGIGMARGGGSSNFVKWGMIGGAVAGGAALISFIPAMKRRAMNVTTILKKDHRMVSGLMMTLQMTPRINGTVRKTLFEQIRTSLLVHAQAEEEILYPAMQTLMLADQSMVSEAYREHQKIKDLLTDLGTMDPVSDAFDVKFKDLKGTIEHHVEEEENEMFAMLKQRMSVEEQQHLGQRIHDRKMSLKSKRAA